MSKQSSRSRLSMWSMSYFPAHVANAKIPHCPPRSKTMSANPTQAFCAKKITKCPAQYLPPLFCFGLTHAPVNNWDLHDLTKGKTANAVSPFVAHPPPCKRKAFANNKGIYSNLEKYMLHLKMRQIVGQTGA